MLVLCHSIVQHSKTIQDLGFGYIDPMVPNRAKVVNNQKSARIERTSIKRRWIDGRSTHMSTPTTPYLR